MRNFITLATLTSYGNMFGVAKILARKNQNLWENDMFLNLISSGFTTAQQLPFAKLRQEVANLLKIPNQRVERVECWQHQLWITINGVGARFVSYRCLPSWLSQVINAIYKACSSEELKKLGKIIHDEIHNHDYEPEAVEELREVYREKHEYFAAIEPEMEHRREAQEWLDSWRGVLSRCTSENSLRAMAVEINAQSQEFEDLPQVMHEMRDIWEARRVSLATA